MGAKVSMINQIKDKKVLNNFSVCMGYLFTTLTGPYISATRCYEERFRAWQVELLRSTASAASPAKGGSSLGERCSLYGAQKVVE